MLIPYEMNGGILATPRYGEEKQKMIRVMYFVRMKPDIRC